MMIEHEDRQRDRDRDDQRAAPASRGTAGSSAPVSTAAIAASRQHAVDRRSHEHRLIEQQLIFSSGGSVGWIRGSMRP